MARKVSTKSVEHAESEAVEQPAAKLPLAKPDRFEQEKMDLMPEYMLWQAVLCTFIVDAKAMCHGAWNERKENRAKSLIHQARSKWCRHICDLVGLPHERLVKTIENYIEAGRQGAQKPRSRVKGEV